MHAPDNREGAGGGNLPRPFVGGDPPAAPEAPQSHAGIPRPFVPGQESRGAQHEAPQSEAVQEVPIGASSGEESVAEAAIAAAEPEPAPPREPPLPQITEFLYEERSGERARSFTPSVPPLPGYNTPGSGHPAAGAQPGSPEPWATGEWQRYDWRGAAALAPDDSARAEQAWSDLDWDADARHLSRDRGEAVAAALEQVARRVRSGDLPVAGRPGMSDEAAVAAALAALLATRR